MTASALIRYGPGHARVLLDGLSDWMSRQGFAALANVRGRLSIPAGADGSVYQRAAYVGTLEAANLGRGYDW